MEIRKKRKRRNIIWNQKENEREEEKKKDIKEIKYLIFNIKTDEKFNNQNKETKLKKANVVIKQVGNKKKDLEIILEEDMIIKS